MPWVAVEVRTVPSAPARSVHGPVGAGALCQRIVTAAPGVGDEVYDAVKTAFCPSRTVCAAGSTTTCQSAAPVAAEGGTALLAEAGSRTWTGECGAASTEGRASAEEADVDGRSVEWADAEGTSVEWASVERRSVEWPWPECPSPESASLEGGGVVAPAVAGSSPTEATTTTSSAADRRAHAVRVGVGLFVMVVPCVVADGSPSRRPGKYVLRCCPRGLGVRRWWGPRP
jgi:hypothetical protein